jgi:site-specific DNA-methyltransferase (adenine-specific)
MLELNKIYNMDCLEGMKQIPDKYFDLVVTDPPYGIGESGKTNHSRSKLAKAKEYKDYGWDKQIPKKEVFNEILRISKNQIIFGGNYFIEYLYNSNCWIVWDKNNGENDFADCELAWTSFKTAVRKFTYTWHGMIQQNMKFKEERFHPTQKPISLMEWIILNYSKEGDLICDPYMGSGTTAIACSRLNRKYLGFELVKEYCSITEKRIQCDSSQVRLII